MNYTSFIGKIIKKPEQSFFNNNTSVTEIIIKFPQLRSTDSGNILHLSIWGNLASDYIEYYDVNDYIVVEGYISLRESLSNSLNSNTDKQVEISVFKIYPFILNSKDKAKFKKYKVFL